MPYATLFCYPPTTTGKLLISLSRAPRTFSCTTPFHERLPPPHPHPLPPSSWWAYKRRSRGTGKIGPSLSFPLFTHMHPSIPSWGIEDGGSV
ncbi:hypothetical protein CEXT_82131 [Caerostris extrusa]|uniref:Uncharacterized protein n=1 Tax=Caerostris extrusa TaxID=172846 RepID=A0AAV4YE65_CAEEX|nr:hypothetical protein CEXT_82131 [Caerostris extrusa]